MIDIFSTWLHPMYGPILTILLIGGTIASLVAIWLTKNSWWAWFFGLGISMLPPISVTVVLAIVGVAFMPETTWVGEYLEQGVIGSVVLLSPIIPIIGMIVLLNFLIGRRK